MVGACEVVLIGAIPGFVPDAGRVVAALGEPVQLVLLGVPPEDIDALAELHKKPELAEELPELDEWTARRFELLSKWGPCEIPSPELASAYAWAANNEVPIRGIDLDDDAHTEAHTTNLKVRHLVRMNFRRNRLLAADLDEKNPYDLALAWDAEENRVKPLQKIQEMREQHMAEEVIHDARKQDYIVVVVPAPRFAGVEARLRQAA